MADLTPKNGNQVFRRYTRPTDVFGVAVHVFYDEDGGQALSKRDCQRVTAHKLGVKDRQARAIVNSYTAEVSSSTGEGWSLPYTGLNEPRFGVSSLQNRLLDHVDQRYKASVQNGKRGGRPAKPSSWDVSSGTTIL